MGYRLSLKEDYKFLVEKNSAGGYEVSLPHQCDKWKILGFENSGGYKHSQKEVEGEPVEGWYPANPTRKEFALTQMELFASRLS